ncbi:TadA family conjugal transfer-associated ATPase [Microbacterium telephonicum]|uniref:Pilus assembly protein CpaF n=1 Tax=Microbacterium telephonicum TaxID=1714841 RepID=A0A498BU68_9MICO|nr:TadA family conjugal transfer-associated ATPase [Microbacterium telephonicum]RLK47464.1 pilus assembly protein CpaF [Microbacterium telephonicum]
MSEPFVVRPRGESPVASARPNRRVPDHPAIAPLRAHLVDPDVTDVFVNGGGALFVDRGRGAEPVAGWHATPGEVRDLAVDLIGIGGRHLDDLAPLVDVRWDNGARVHAVLAPVAVDGAVISIRLPSAQRLSLDDLGRQGMFDAATGAVLAGFVADRENVLVSGATGAGKTTLLSALLGLVPHDERIVTIEDVAELRIDHPHHVRLESRQPNLEGAGGVGLARLVREALRMRPDRLVVGECRGEEVRELLSALNTGHDGGAGTVHAGGIDDVPARLEALGALAGLDDRALARQVASAVGAVVHVGRGVDGVRRVTRIARPVVVGDRLEIRERS